MLALLKTRPQNLGAAEIQARRDYMRNQESIEWGRISESPFYLGGEWGLDTLQVRFDDIYFNYPATPVRTRGFKFFGKFGVKDFCSNKKENMCKTRFYLHPSLLQATFQ